MNTDIKVSVVVPVYNVQEYIGECIDSILGQTYKNIELILVEDGSTDSSLAICQEASEKDSRVKLIVKNNSGASEARNAGIDASTGDYVMFVDSDDYIVETAIEQVVDVAVRSDAPMVIWNMERLLFGLYTPYDWQMERETVITDIPMIQRHMLNRYADDELKLDNLIVLGSPCNKLIKRSIFNNVFVRFNANVVYQEDLLMFFNMMNHIDKVVFYNEVLYHYRWRDGSITRGRKLDDPEKWVDTLEGFKTALKAMEADERMLRSYDIYVVLVLKNIIFDCFIDKTDDEESRPTASDYGRIVKEHVIDESLSYLKISSLPGMQHKFIAFCTKYHLYNTLLSVSKLYLRRVEKKRAELTAINKSSEFYVSEIE